MGDDDVVVRNSHGKVKAFGRSGAAYAVSGWRCKRGRRVDRMSWEMRERGDFGDSIGTAWVSAWLRVQCMRVKRPQEVFCFDLNSCRVSSRRDGCGGYDVEIYGFPSSIEACHEACYGGRIGVLITFVHTG